MILSKAKYCKNFLTYRSNIFIFLSFFFRSNDSIFPMMTIKPLLTCYYKLVNRKAYKFDSPVYFVIAFEDKYEGNKPTISSIKTKQLPTNQCYHTNYSHGYTYRL